MEITEKPIILKQNVETADTHFVKHVNEMRCIQRINARHFQSRVYPLILQYAVTTTEGFSSSDFAACFNLCLQDTSAAINFMLTFQFL